MFSEHKIDQFVFVALKKPLLFCSSNFQFYFEGRQRAYFLKKIFEFSNFQGPKFIGTI